MHSPHFSMMTLISILHKFLLRSVLRLPAISLKQIYIYIYTCCFMTNFLIYIYIYRIDNFWYWESIFYYKSDPEASFYGKSHIFSVDNYNTQIYNKLDFRPKYLGMVWNIIFKSCHVETKGNMYFIEVKCQNITCNLILYAT